MRNIRRFLEEGDKCKITLRFRGREITHQEIGMALLQRIRDELGDLIVVEQFPKLEGRQMIMMIAPGRKKAGGAAKPAAEPQPHRRRPEKSEIRRDFALPVSQVQAGRDEEVARGQQAAEHSRRLTSTN